MVVCRHLKCPSLGAGDQYGLGHVFRSHLPLLGLLPVHKGESEFLYTVIDWPRLLTLYSDCMSQLVIHAMLIL